MKNIFQRKGFRISFFVISLAIFAFIGNESKAFTCGTDTVSYGGKNYATVQIGDQCWFKENLNVGTMLASGATMPSDPAPTLNDPSTVQKWCYNNSSAICDTDGGLYTWAEANALANSCNSSSCSVSTRNQGICPTGWHIPSDTEFKMLEVELGMTQEQADVGGFRGTDQGSRLATLTLNGTNSSEFTALLSGFRHITNGSFNNRTADTYFWFASEYSASNAWFRALYSSQATIYRDTNTKTYGFSVRCLQDAAALDPKTVTNPTPEDIEEDITAGIITVSGTNTQASSATINTNYTLQTGSFQYLIPSGTTITPTSGTMDITALAVSDISQTIQEQNSNSKGAIKIGIPNKNVTFSQDITVTLDISSDYNNKTLTIYSRPDNGETWTEESTCLVTDGQCSFTTDHATEYTANYEVSNSPTPTDVNLDLTATISLTCTDSVTLGTITGTGQSNLTTNEASCNVRTINSSGYQLSWQASTPYLENENGDQIAAYTPQTPDTPEVWSVSSTESEWGGRIKTTSTDPDLTGSEIWDNTDSYSGTWLNVSASPFIIANRITETSQTGSDEVILFGAEIGSNKFQPTGTYDTDVIITATTL